MAIGKPRTANLGMLAIVAAASLWAISANVASYLFQAGMTPLELTMARSIVAALGLGLLQAGRARFLNLAAPEQPRDGQIPRWQCGGWPVLLLGLTFGLVMITYYIAIDRLDVAVAIVLQYTAPVLVVLWTALQLRQAPARSLVFALFTAFIGVVLVSELPQGDWSQLDLVGLLIGLLSAIVFAVYTVLSERLASRYGALTVTGQAFMIAGLFWFAVQTSQGWPALLFVPQNLLSILFVGIGGTLMPFSLYCWGIQHLRADRAAIAATLEPVMAAVIAWIWLGQVLSLMQIGGGILVLLSLTGLQKHQADSSLPTST